MKCNNCGSEEFTEIYHEEYGGVKGSSKRKETEKTIYQCDECGSQGKKFVDGVDGGITYSGILR